MDRKLTSLAIPVLCTVLVGMMLVWVYGPASAQAPNGMNRYRSGVVCIRLTPAAVASEHFRLTDGRRSDTLTGLGQLDGVLRPKGLRAITLPGYTPANTTAAHALGLDRDFILFVDDTVNVIHLSSRLSSLADIADVIQHKVNGFLHNNSKEELIRYMLEAYNNYDDLDLMRRKARETIINGHSYKVATVKWNDLLKKLK